MRINTNLTAMNTFTQYTNNNSKIAKSVAKLSSGSAINSAADNATGLAISEKMRAQIRGLEKASTNAQDAISLVQSAEGALSSSTEILQRMRELAVQSASDTNENEIDRTALQDEFSQLQNELNDIAKNTTFNKKNLLDGSLATESKNLGTTSLANSGMTIQLGNAATGSYNFSVSTKLESAAVDGRDPNTPELVTDGAATYFSGTNSVALGANVAASDLLNGNYSLSASYKSSANDGGDDQITVTAKGDNGQSFEAKVSAADLTALSSGTPSLTLNFNEGADDAFNITLGLGSTVAASESNYDTLASNISKLSVSVTGGVTAKNAEYGVYANLTGAESVKLESGMGSVTFENGVKINFDTLTASSIDTTNKASLSANVTFTGNGTNGMANTATAAFSNLKAYDDASISNGAGTVSITGATATAVTFTMEDSAGSTFTATALKADLGLSGAAAGVSTPSTLTFKDASGKEALSIDLVVTNTAGSANFLNAVGTATTQAATVQDAGHNYDTIFGTASTVTTAPGTMTTNGSIVLTNLAAGSITNDASSGTADNFLPLNGYSVATGNMTISVNNTTDDLLGDITLTATDNEGNVFTSYTAPATAWMHNTPGPSMTTSIVDFYVDPMNPATEAFAFRLRMTNVDGASYIEDGASFTLNVTGPVAPGTSTTNASTASSFSVEAQKNSGLTFQVGANQGDEMTINIDKMDANYLGVASASVVTRSAASSAIKSVDSAINQVSSQRAYLGAIQNRLEYKISNLNTSTENLTSAESQIRDVDMAKEMTAFTNANILNQASTAMLAQANSLPQSVLSLIGK